MSIIKNTNKEIGRRIQYLREQKNETQTQVAKAVGVSREVFNHWEGGGRAVKPEYVIALSRHFNVSSDFLLGISAVETNNTDLKAICDYTGLIEPAVERLHKLKYLLDNDKVDLREIAFAPTPAEAEEMIKTMLRTGMEQLKVINMLLATGDRLFEYMRLAWFDDFKELDDPTSEICIQAREFATKKELKFEFSPSQELRNSLINKAMNELRDICYKYIENKDKV
jgi:transcriptional regulator with XRE-family HTH domain